ncbi:MAG: rod-binding protein [Treponema sp.]|jgi:flagellar protein FlgJ|nr:rod-binding protein [Treponema sp.]
MPLNGPASVYTEGALPPAAERLASYVNRGGNAGQANAVNHNNTEVNAGKGFAGIYRKTFPRGEADKGAGLREAALVDTESELYKQCEALETFLVKNLLTSMRGTIQKSGLINEGFAGKMYEDMLYDEYAKDFTKNAGFGLARLAYLELTGQRGRQG